MNDECSGLQSRLEFTEKVPDPYLLKTKSLQVHVYWPDSMYWLSETFLFGQVTWILCFMLRESEKCENRRCEVSRESLDYNCRWLVGDHVVVIDRIYCVSETETEISLPTLVAMQDDNNIICHRSFVTQFIQRSLLHLFAELEPSLSVEAWVHSAGRTTARGMSVLDSPDRSQRKELRLTFWAFG